MGVGSAWVRFSLLLPIVVVLTACGGTPDEGGSPSYRETGAVIAMSGANAGAAGACATCHGLKGEGDGAETPRLAGLDAGYLHRQLDDYVAGRRDHKEMRAIARRLSPADRAKVAAYYATLPFEGRTGATTDLKLYRQRCAACHGAAGEGMGPGNPPLAGQPAGYIAAQLYKWRSGERYNDALGEMRQISRRLSPSEIRAVSAYASRLGDVRPRPAPAASPPARRGGPKNGA